MLKMAKKSLMVVTLLLCIAGGSLAAYAAFTVTSNVAGPVTINYSIIVDIGGYPTITATLSNGVTPVAGATPVRFWYYSAPTGTISGTPTFDPLTWTNYDNETTNLSGVATSTFSPPANGYDYWFAATYVP